MGLTKSGVSVAHSGDAGDVIFSLPVARYYGPVDFFLSPATFTRVKMTPERVPQFRRLLLAQPYINRVDFHHGRAVTYNLDHFRWRFKHSLWAESLAQMHVRAFDVPDAELDKPWLITDPNRVAKVVINLTSRYRNNEFPWQDVYRKYHRDAVFVGSVEEHQQFVAHYGPIPHYRTADLWELSRVIAGSQLFIGNQSCPLAIAHGLQHPTLCELSRTSCNGFVRTINCISSAGSSVDLPTI